MKHKKAVNDQEHDDNLKGTLFAVAIIGLFIILSWSGVWYLFISR